MASKLDMDETQGVIHAKAKFLSSCETLTHFLNSIAGEAWVRHFHSKEGDTTEEKGTGPL